MTGRQRGASDGEIAGEFIQPHRHAALLGAGDKPRVVALNKVDLLGPAGRRRSVQELRRRYPAAMAISAEKRIGLEGLLEALDAASRPDVVQLELLVPYGEEGALVELR